MNDNDSIPSVGAPGSITIVDTDVGDLGARRTTNTKRLRAEAQIDLADLGAPDAHRSEAGAAPTYHVSEAEAYGEIEEGVEAPAKSDVQRLLDAKHRRRRLGRHMAQDQIQEDLDDVKKFLALPEADREAYLTIYEYDGSTDNLVEGLAKASSLALRIGLAYTVAPKDYDLAAMALDMPEVKDSLATIWDCIDIDQYTETKLIKGAAAVGHIGDTLMGAAMKLYQGIARAAELRERHAALEKRKAAGVQSVFDLSGNNGVPDHAQSTTTGTATVVETI